MSGAALGDGAARAEEGRDDCNARHWWQRPYCPGSGRRPSRQVRHGRGGAPFHPCLFCPLSVGAPIPALPIRAALPPALQVKHVPSDGHDGSARLVARLGHLGASLRPELWCGAVVVVAEVAGCVQVGRCLPPSCPSRRVLLSFRSGPHADHRQRGTGQLRLAEAAWYRGHLRSCHPAMWLSSCPWQPRHAPFLSPVKG